MIEHPSPYQTSSCKHALTRQPEAETICSGILQYQYGLAAIMSTKNNQHIDFTGLIGRCGDRDVFLGFASTRDLFNLSFADVLDETTGRGYQRRFSKDHSLAFRKYIKTPGATTIPLTFNLRADPSGQWELISGRAPGQAVLRVQTQGGKVLAQVDCQHRLGHLADLDVPLTFMTFLGLPIKEEMEIFSTINGKAKGLSSSLLDFHEAKLTRSLGTIRPELLIALRLAEDERSPWFRRLDMGGDRTVGMYRYASLRTMQKAGKRFLRESGALASQSAEEVADVAISFWCAVTDLLPTEWSRPRNYLITKGVGVYSLMSLAGELYKEALTNNIKCDTAFLAGQLSDFLGQIDWSSSGPLRGYGGISGADQAYELLRTVRQQALKITSYGKQEHLTH